MAPERIEFPSHYPIKVVARTEPALRARIDAVFERHFGPGTPDGVGERQSSQGHFIALTYVPRVEHEDQLRALHAELKSLEGVMVVL
jgi:putative lipoic acid-binding regulatory protein